MEKGAWLASLFPTLEAASCSFSRVERGVGRADIFIGTTCLALVCVGFLWPWQRFFVYSLEAPHLPSIAGDLALTHP